MAETVIGSYRITGQLGAGGMGAVYAGEHQHLGRKAAIKVLLPELSGNEEMVTRFFNEAKAATAIKHPGIVQIYDFGYQDDDSAYIAMEFLEGEGLDTRLRRLGALPVQQALRFAGQIASALAAAHERGIYHRDLKPPNIFIVADQQVAGGERIKILDFGIAKVTHLDEPGAGMTRAGSVMGSPSYMAPEQCRGAGEIDHRADLYSLGCILFAMLCGRRPFDGGGNGPLATMAAQLNDPPPVPSSLRPELTEELDALVLQLLAKEPAQRPQSAAEVAEWVSALSGERVSFASMSGITGGTDAFPTRPEQSTVPAGSTTGQHGGRLPDGGRLIDQLASRPTERDTGTGRLAGGDTDQVGQPTAARSTTRSSRLSQDIVPSAEGTPRQGRGGRGLLLAAVLLVAAGGGLALTQMGGDSQPAPEPTVAEPVAEPSEPAVEEPPPKPREPKLSFLSIEERAERKARREAAGGSEEVAAGGMTNMIRLELPSLSLSSLFSGTLFGGILETFSLLLEPEPVIITWRLATEPPGAEVIRDGEVLGTTEQPLLIELEETPEFVANFTLRLDRYEDATIELHGDESYEEVITLVPKVYATVASRPPGADILDAEGTRLGVTPLEIELSRGEDGNVLPMTVTLARERYEDTALELAGTESFEERVRLRPKIYATVESRPEGAEVFDAEGTSLGTAPVTFELPREDQPAIVTLELEDYRDTEVKLRGRRTFTKRARLRPKPRLTIASQVEGAEVFDAEGTSLGTAPVEVVVSGKGEPMAFTLRRDGYHDKRVEIAIRRDKKIKVRMAPDLGEVTMQIASTPEGAEVWRDGEMIGRAPVEDRFEGTPGKVEYTLKLDGYRHKTIRVAGDTDSSENVKLRKCEKRRSGQLGIVRVYGGC